MYITQDHKHIVVPWRPDVAQTIPHARPFVHEGQSWLLLPNGPDETKICRNLGVYVPPPILTRYQWGGKTPWEVQRTTAALLSESPRAYVLSAMGTGKTLAALFAADYLMRRGAIKRVLIAAPLSTISVVWESELFKFLPHTRVSVLHGSREKRLKELASGAPYCVINHHGLRVIERALLDAKFDLIILDELAAFRTKNTDLWRTANHLAAVTKYVWGLTGSPTPQSPLDAWAQVRLLTPSRVSKAMTLFRDRTMVQLSAFKWVARPGANDIVHEIMQPSVRFTRDDIAELPPTTYVDREAKLDPEAAKAYKMLYDKMAMLSSSGQITAVNEAVLQNKLLQVACGYIYTDSREVYRLPAPTRLAALDQVIDETDRKIIVFVPYVHALEGVSEYLTKKGHSVAVVCGDTPRTARDRIFRAFQEATEPRVIVAHPQCMAHGLSLTAANTIVWYSPTQSLEIYAQANARITRPGQTAKTLIVHFSGTSVERATYRRLRERSRMQGLLLSLFAEQEIVF